MTYGSATTAEHVAEYFAHIYKSPSLELIADFENRYRLVGRSPLVEITQKQAALLQEKLGTNFVVRAGMRHSAPFIADAVAECRAEGATVLRGIILSPQYSPVIMRGYETEFATAAQQGGFTDFKIAPPWPTQPRFVELLAQRIERALTQPMPVIFTTHSLPKKVIDQDPSYLSQLQATIDAVRALLPADLKWCAAYQSAGHTPEEWLKPDLVDVLRELRGKKSSVLIVPIQFLSDHLEVLYDLDIAARAQCEEFGIAYNRIELPNTHPLFISALSSLI